MLSCSQDIKNKISSLLGENVSRETFLKLEAFLFLLKTENQKYNLVGPKEVDRLWDRHVLDCAQLVPLLKSPACFLDVGSGAGFPGVVLSLLGVPGGHLVESSQKKCSFLKNVSRETKADFSVLCHRVETLKGFSFGVVVSRAVAPTEMLLCWVRKVLRPESRCFFLKGKTFESELTEARKKIFFEVVVHPSITSSEGKILEIYNIRF